MASETGFSELNLSSQLGNVAARQDGMQLDRMDQAGDNAEDRVRRAPVLNQLQEAIPRVIDETAEQVRVDFQVFLTEFIDEETHTNVYVEQIKYLSQHEITTVYIDFGHLAMFNEILAQIIATQYYRMEPYLRKAVQNLVRQHDPDYLNIKTGGQVLGEGQSREFWIGWYGMNHVKRLRELRMETQSQLTAISGTVTRTSEVRPELLFGTFNCAECGSTIRDVEQEFKYTEPTTCFNPECGNRTAFHLVPDQSKFADWQKIRIQENANEVPSGAMPRSMDVIVRNETVEKTKPGDKIIVTGMPIVVPDVAQLIGNKVESARNDRLGRGRDGFTQEGVTGLKVLGVRDLTYKLVFLGSFIQHAEAKSALNALHDMYGDEDPAALMLAQMTEEQIQEIREMKQDRRIYQKLASSIAPHIFGHEDIKKGVLLQMLGGVHKTTPEGIKLRGDINVCIVGDPSTAKSQFLKYVSNFMPRAIYTSGKASSAAGLTASVVKDEETGEFTIEAGALMLADNGVCCIDEFDKMDLTDQVAIHEAMEQQTISIAKAGIQATLNARSSILAAANPIHGRYDKKLSLKQNIAMTPPIMSRFDLFFVILDECHEQTDLCIAQHIVNFHRYREHGVQPEFSTEQLRRYLMYARSLKPRLTEEAREFLVTEYRNLRLKDAVGVNRSSYRITVRQLESMIRLAEAVARAQCDEEVLIKHVTEATHLLKTSIVHVQQEDISLLTDEDDMSAGVMKSTEVGLMDDETLADAAGSGEGMLSQQPFSTGDDSHTGTSDANDAAAVSAPPKQTVVLSAEEYQKIVQSVILQIKRHEKASSTPTTGGSAPTSSTSGAQMSIEEELLDSEQQAVQAAAASSSTSAADSAVVGMRRGDLVDWYLETMEEAQLIETEEQFMHQRKIIKSVLTRMVKKDGILLAIRDATRLSGGEDVSSAEQEQQPRIDPDDEILMINPAHYIEGEEMF